MATVSAEVPTKVFTESEFYLEVDFEGGYFDVVYGEPIGGVNLTVTEKEDEPTNVVSLIVNTVVENYQERNFEDRLVGELTYWNTDRCSVFSSAPLDFTHLRKGFLIYQGVANEDDFGPFHHYRYIRK